MLLMLIKILTAAMLLYCIAIIVFCIQLFGYPAASVFNKLSSCYTWRCQVKSWLRVMASHVLVRIDLFTAVVPHGCKILAISIGLLYSQSEILCCTRLYSFMGPWISTVDDYCNVISRTSHNVMYTYNGYICPTFSDSSKLYLIGCVTSHPSFWYKDRLNPCRNSEDIAVIRLHLILPTLMGYKRYPSFHPYHFGNRIVV